MSYTNFFKINNSSMDSLNLNEMTVYAVISCKSTKNVSNITRERISEFSDIKKLDTISKYTEKLKDLNLIKKEVEYLTKTKQILKYHLMKLDNNFTMVNNKLLDLECGAIGFAIKLSYMRVNGTNWIGLTDKKIYKRLGISVNTFKKYREILYNNGILTSVKDGYELNEDIFPVIRTYNKSKESDLLKMSKDFKGRIVFMYYYVDNYKGLRMDINKFLDWCLAGCPGINKKKVESKHTIYEWDMDDFNIEDYQ